MLYVFQYAGLLFIYASLILNLGLDPAGPAFYKDEPQVRLTKNDAAYVDILHTNGGYSLMQGIVFF